MDDDEIKDCVLRYFDSVLLKQNFPEEVKLDISSYFAEGEFNEQGFKILKIAINQISSLKNVNNGLDSLLDASLEKNLIYFVETHLEEIYNSLPVNLRSYVEDLINYLKVYHSSL